MTSDGSGNPPFGSQQQSWAPQEQVAEREQAPDQVTPGGFAPSGSPEAAQAAYPPQTGYAPQAQPAAGLPGASGLPAPAGYTDPQAATTCPNCRHQWTGSQTCSFCGQVWGLPNGIVLSSVGRRFGGYLLDGVLVVVTLVIGWIIWTLIVWAQGQTPAKQLLGMRVVRLDQRTYAGWGRMFLRDFVGKLIVGVVGALLFGVGDVIADLWLLWDKDRQQLWDKIAGTVVVDDPDKRLAPTPQTQAA
jgi:uncharacterized RDD family membrane protein YckC